MLLWWVFKEDFVPVHSMRMAIKMLKKIRHHRFFWLSLIFNPRFRQGAKNATLYRMGYKQGVLDQRNGRVVDAI
jgi:hypothetical protein